MKKMNERLNTLFPVSFGGFAGGYKGFTIGAITVGGIIDCIVYAGLGALVGYGMKMFLDYIKHKYEMKKKRQNRKRR